MGARHYGINASAASWIIGDHATDVMTGYNAGIEGGIHVLTGHGTHDGEREKALALQTEHYRVYDADSIADALTIIAISEGI